MNWEDTLKKSKSLNKRNIEKSVKKVAIDFFNKVDNFDRVDLIKYITDNLVNQVIADDFLDYPTSTKTKLAKGYIRYKLDSNIQTFLKLSSNYGFYRDKYKRITGAGHGKGSRISSYIKKAKIPAVKTEKYNLYVVFIKKILKKEGGAAGMKNFLDEGNKIKNFNKEFLNYVISDALDHDDWLAEHEFGDFYLKE